MDWNDPFVERLQRYPLWYAEEILSHLKDINQYLTERSVDRRELLSSLQILMSAIHEWSPTVHPETIGQEQLRVVDAEKEFVADTKAIEHDIRRFLGQGDSEIREADLLSLYKKLSVACLKFQLAVASNGLPIAALMDKT